MIKTLLMLVTSLSLSCFAEDDIDLGFLNQDSIGKICFVGVSLTDFEYSGSVALDHFSEEDQQLISDCQESKAAGQNVVVEVTSVSTKSWNPSKQIYIYPVKRGARCIELPEDSFSDFLVKWRSEVRDSTFTNCE